MAVIAKSASGVTFSFSIAGDEKTLAAFKALPDVVQKKVLRPALRAGAKIVRTHYMRRIPSKSGHAATTVKVKAGKRSRKFPDRVTVNVQTGKGDFKGKGFYLAINELGWKAGSRKTYAAGTFNVKEEGGQFISGAVNPFAGGHKLGFRWIQARIPVKGKHWFRKAREAGQSEAQAAIHRLVKEGIAREAGKLGK